VRNLFSKLWNDDAGIVALEYLLVATIIGLGLVVGLSSLSAALNVELTELANAILSLDQSYSIAGQSSCVGTKSGVTVNDSNAGTVTYTIIPGSPASLTNTYTVSITVCP